MVRFLELGLSVAVLCALGGCGPDYSPNTYAAAAAQQAAKVERGVIVGFREVAISADGTVGTVTGGAAGGLVGAQAPGGGFASAIGALGGTVIGGIVGSTVEHATDDSRAFEYIVRQPNGDLVSVTQKDKEPLAIGLTVLVITGKQARVVPDYTVSVPVPSQAATTTEPAKPQTPVTATPLSAPAGGMAPPDPGKPPARGTPSVPVSLVPPAPDAGPAASSGRSPDTAPAAAPAAPSAAAAAPPTAAPSTAAPESPATGPVPPADAVK